LEIGAVTKSDYLKKLKMLDKWLNGGDEPSDRTRKVKTGIGKKHYKLPSQLITPDEAKKLTESTDNPRDRALIHLLWESGCRVGEAINAKIGNIQFDKGEARINLHGKVGARQVLLLESVRDIKDYLKDRTLSSSDEPLFVTYGSKSKGEPLHHACINRAIARAAERANVKKHVYAYLFRHSRASYLASKGLSEAQLCNIFGWEVGSRQVRTYVHLSGAQVETAYKQLYGIKKLEAPEQQLIQCQICGESNPATNESCQHCYNPLTIQGALKIKQEKDVIQYDRDISQKVFAEAFKLMAQGKLTPEQAQAEAIKIIATKEAGSNT
jgi:site-specific recombinase XerD